MAFISHFQNVFSLFVFVSTCVLTDQNNMYMGLFLFTVMILLWFTNIFGKTAVFEQ
jgi:hypothetical protein